MKRMSKREIGFRFDMIYEARVRIDRLEGGNAVVKLEGVECRFDLLRTERRDLSATGAIPSFVNSYEARQGDGWLPRGTKHDESEIQRFFRATSRKRPVYIHSVGLDSGSNHQKYEDFARLHPVGSIVEGEVIDRYSDKIRIRLEGGVNVRMGIRDYVDRWPRVRRLDLGNVHWPNRVEVIVRRIDLERHVVVVTMHGYPKDGKYCNATAGYRASYDAREGMFRLLPWERGEETRHEQ